MPVGYGSGVHGAIVARRARVAPQPTADATWAGASVGSVDTDSGRRTMIERHLRARGLTDSRVLEAMAAVDRRAFVSPSLSDQAYSDRALPLERGQTISQPYVVAAMIDALELRPTDRVLEIGGGSGYAAAVAAQLAAEVVAVERDEGLAADAVDRLAALGYDNVETVVGDGSAGLPDRAPFDAIMVSAACPEVPRPLIEQLAPGGRLVAPVGPRWGQTLVLLRSEDGRLERQELFPVAFVPLVGDHAWGEHH